MLRRRQINIIIPRLKLLIEKALENCDAKTICTKMNWLHKDGIYMVYIIMYILFSNKQIKTEITYNFKKLDDFTPNERQQKIFKIMKENKRLKNENESIEKLNNLNKGPMHQKNLFDVNWMMEQSSPKTKQFQIKIEKYYNLSWKILSEYITSNQ